MTKRKKTKTKRIDTNAYSYSVLLFINPSLKTTQKHERNKRVHTAFSISLPYFPAQLVQPGTRYVHLHSLSGGRGWRARGGWGVLMSCMAVVVMTIDPRIPTMPGRSTSGFHRSGRHFQHQARIAVRCVRRVAWRMSYIVLRTACEADFLACG